MRNDDDLSFITVVRMRGLRRLTFLKILLGFSMAARAARAALALSTQLSRRLSTFPGLVAAACIVVAVVLAVKLAVKSCWRRTSLETMMMARPGPNKTRKPKPLTARQRPLRDTQRAYYHCARGGSMAELEKQIPRSQWGDARKLCIQGAATIKLSDAVVPETKPGGTQNRGIKVGQCAYYTKSQKKDGSRLCYQNLNSVGATNSQYLRAQCAQSTECVQHLKKCAASKSTTNPGCRVVDTVPGLGREAYVKNTYPDDPGNMPQREVYMGPNDRDRTCSFYAKSQKIGGAWECARGMRNTNVETLGADVAPHFWGRQCVGSEVRADNQDYCAKKAMQEALGSRPAPKGYINVDRSTGSLEPIM